MGREMNTNDRYSHWYFIVYCELVPRCSGNFSALYFYNYSIIVFVMPLSGSSIGNIFISSSSLFTLTDFSCLISCYDS